MPDRAPLDDITVVGAGSSGLACATVPARARRKVLMREGHDDVGHRFNDDFQRPENWSGPEHVLTEISSADICPDFEYHPFDSGTVSDPRRGKISGAGATVTVLSRAARPTGRNTGSRVAGSCPHGTGTAHDWPTQAATMLITNAFNIHTAATRRQLSSPRNSGTKPNRKESPCWSKTS